MATEILQLSDTHFLAPGEAPEGGFAYDTTAAFHAVMDAVAEESFDFVVVTGDVADHGRPEQYDAALAAFERIDPLVFIVPGNHDQDAKIRDAMGLPLHLDDGAWRHIFVDSNTGVMLDDGDGGRVDPPEYHDRLHNEGSITEAEADRVAALCVGDFEHVMLWVHHPPGAPVGLTANPAYDAQWRELLLPRVDKVRAIGGGHTHVPQSYEFEGISAHVSPALKNAFDLVDYVTLPPGARRWTFADDGSVESTVVLAADDPQWPRREMSPLVVALFNGEVAWDEFNAIVARKAAERASGQG